MNPTKQIERPATLEVEFDAIPEELEALPQWVLWKATLRDGKWTKVPINANSGSSASSTEKTTWTKFGDLSKRLYRNSGIGWVFAPDDPYCGIDLDKCRNAETGEIEPWAQEIIDAFDSYTEISPSGTGVHIIIRGKLPPGGNRKGQVEMYDRARFFLRDRPRG